MRFRKRGHYIEHRSNDIIFTEVNCKTLSLLKHIHKATIILWSPVQRRQMEAYKDDPTGSIGRQEAQREAENSVHGQHLSYNKEV